MNFRLWCAALVLLVSVPTFAQRLPNTVKPEHYSLHLTPDLKAATFAGEETIDVQLTTPAKTITLNSADIKMSSVTAKAAKGAAMVGAVTYDEAKQQATLTFPKMLPAGPVKLTIAYTGILNDKLRGFYLSKTEKRNYAVTQFESTDARRAFPSFDEPALKATFDIALTVDKGDTVISNTNMVSDVPVGEAKHTQTFATTPKMSTYLVAFQVGDWVCSSGEADGIPIRSCSTPDKLALTPFALEAAEHFLHYYDQYFGVKYAMPKLDMIGIPDFEAGAMENWGCITYRETALLVDPKTASRGALENVAIDVAHEMAHQWFGDLVTLEWWNNLWLNEGFATWMEFKAVGEWKPDWKLNEDAASSVSSVLDLDAAPTTRTIRAKADTPDEINEAFDGISYGKGGAVIGMVEHYLGPDVFQKGVQKYMQAHKYANATAEDFWNVQTATSGKAIDKIMDSFISQPGTPLLMFSEGDAGSMNVTQSRFFLTPKKDVPAQTWTVPVCVVGAPCQVIHGTLSTVKKGTGVYANADGRGYYRTNYSPGLLKEVIASAPTLKPEERIALVGDRLAMMRAGLSSVGDYMSLANSLKNETNPDVLSKVIQGVSTVETRIADPSQEKQVDAWILKTFGPVYASMGPAKATDTEDEVQRRLTLLPWLVITGDPAATAEVQSFATRAMQKDPTLNPQYIGTAVSLAVRHGDATIYDRILEVSQTATDPETKEEALQSLAEFTDPALVARTLEYASSGKVKNQDSAILMAIELSQRETRNVAWAWLKANWDKAASQFTTFSGSEVVGATGSFCTEADRADVQQFFAAHKVAASEQALTHALQSIDSCVAQRKMLGPSLAEWLKTQQ